MIVSSLQNCVVAVSKWCASKRLQLNVKKTELLLFGSVTELRKVDPSLRGFTVGTDVIQPVGVVRDLEVYFDSHLTMKAHVARVARDLLLPSSSSTIDTTQSRTRCDRTTCFSTSNLTTGLLQLCAYSFTAPLQRVLNAAVRLVHDLGPREHVTPAMYELHWLPIAKRIKFKLCLLVFHAVNGRAPSYLTELVSPVANIPGRTSLRSAGRHDLVVPRSRLVLSERAFSVAAPRAWNSLPVDIRLITDTKRFKKKLKTFLFNSAYHGIRQWNFV